MAEKLHTPRNPGVLLVWVRAHVSLFLRLSRGLTREICTYLSPDALWLAGFYLNRLYVCDFGETDYQVRNPVELRANVHTFRARWTTIDSTRLVLCGGKPIESKDQRLALRRAYLISRTGSVQELSNMLHGHSSHGLITWHGGVLVFGSLAKPGGRKCERLDLKEMQWELLPELNQPRHDFTPAEWRNAVYLCGGGAASIEVFDGHSMRLLSLKLMDKGEMWTCASNTALFISSPHNYSTVFKPAGSATLRLKWKKLNAHRQETTFLLWRKDIVAFSVDTYYWEEECYETTRVVKYSTKDCSQVGS